MNQIIYLPEGTKDNRTSPAPIQTALRQARENTPQDAQAIGIIDTENSLATPQGTTLASLAETHDAISAEARTLDKSVYETYGEDMTHDLTDLDTCIDAIDDAFPALRETMRRYLYGRKSLASRTLIARRPLFDQWSTLLTTALDARNQTCHTHHDADAPLAELITGIFVQSLLDQGHDTLLLPPATTSTPKTPDDTPTSPLHLSTFATTNGIAYTQLKNTPADGLTARAASHGHPLPAMILPDPTGGHPLMAIAAIPHTQTITLTTPDTTQRLTTHVTPRQIHRQSRLLPLSPTRRALSAQRNNNAAENAPHPEIDAIRPADNGSDIIRGHITLPGLKPDERMDMRLLARDGALAGIGPWTLLGETTGEARTVFFSMRALPNTSFYLWAHFPDAARSDAFRFFDAPHVMRMRAAWVEAHGQDGEKESVAALPLPSPQPTVSVVIPTRGDVTVLNRCLTSLFTMTSYTNIDITVADGEENAVDALPEAWRARLARLRPTLHFQPGANPEEAVAGTCGEYVVLLGEESQILRLDWVEQLVGLCLPENRGAVAARAVLADGAPREGDDQTAACVMARRADLATLGGLRKEAAVRVDATALLGSVRKAGMETALSPEALLIDRRMPAMPAGKAPAGRAANR